jgi:DNA polymerase
MELFIDMETRSEVDLRKTGVYPYAEHESTHIHCIAVKADDCFPSVWIHPNLHEYRPNDYAWMEEHLQARVLRSEELIEFIDKADHIHAHNAQFERVMWNRVMVSEYGFPPIPDELWRCTAALAASYALPRDLERAARVLQLPVQKDKAGHRIMFKMCKPKKDGTWHEDLEDFLKLCEYCITDVETEYGVYTSLLDLPPFEQLIYRLDQEINDNGVHIDVDAVQNLIYKIELKEQRLLDRVNDITSGALQSTRQRDATLAWLKANGLDLENLQKETVKKVIEKEPMSDPVLELLQIRQAMAKSSVSKLSAMLRVACRDKRARGTILYHAAGTGRFGGRLLQPQNLPRDSYGDEEIEALLAKGVDEIEESTESMFHEASKCLRGMLTAAPGSVLIAGDFSSIEGRGLAWVSGEKHVLQNYREGLSPYKVNAADVYEVEYDAVTDKQRFVGKTIELACGYQGWLGAFRQMGSDEVNKMTDEEIEGIIRAWRASRPATTAFWSGLESAACMAVRTGRPYEFGSIKYAVRDKFLHCRLPSGRLLSYFRPHFRDVETPYGVKNSLVYWSTHPESGQWVPTATYGGKLTENVVQAMCRDILCEALIAVRKCGFKIVLHVHDEIVVEVPESEYSDAVKNTFFDAMTIQPDWAPDMPIKVSGWVGRRYRK